MTSPAVPRAPSLLDAVILGVPTIEYLPFAFFNLVNPVIAVVFGFTGFRVERIGPPGAETGTAIGAETAPRQEAT